MARPKSAKKLHLKRYQNYIGIAVGMVLLTAGLIFGGFDLIRGWYIQNGHEASAQMLQPTPPVFTSERLVHGKPASLTIPAVGINLAVQPGYYNDKDQTWTLSLDKAQWGTRTAELNNKGGLVYIYAHFRKGVFYDLPKVKVGDEVRITSDKGIDFIYTYRESTVAEPSDTSIFSYTGKPILVLQTCSGIWYEKRQLFIFDYKSNTHTEAS